jgi:O-antigen ligase
MKGLLLIYLIVGLGFVGALWRPMIGLYVYMFLGVLRPKYMWGFAGNLESMSDYVGTAMLVGWAIHGFGSHRPQKGRFPIYAAGLFLLWTILSAAQAVDKTVAFAPLPDFLKILLPCLVGITMMGTTQRVRHIMWIIVGAQAYVCLELNLNYVLDGDNRVATLGYGGLDNNAYGINLLATLGAAFVLPLTTRNWTERGLGAAAAVLILHTILLTFSRGAFIGLIAAGVAAFVFMPKHPRNLAALALVVLLVVRLIGPELATRYSTSFNQRGELDYAASSRLDLWERMFAVALTIPVFGVGPDNWPVVAQDYGFPPGKHGHSLWVQTLVEIGFPGVLALAAMYLGCIAQLWGFSIRHRKTERDAAVLAAGLIISLVAYVISAQFVTLQRLEIPFYMVMAGVLLMNKKDTLVAAALPAPRRGPVIPSTRVALPALSRQSSPAYAPGSGPPVSRGTKR